MACDYKMSHKRRETVRPGAMIKKPWNAPEYVSRILSSIMKTIIATNIYV